MGDVPAAEITGRLDLAYKDIAEVPDRGFDACPYTAATALALDFNESRRLWAPGLCAPPELTYLARHNNRTSHVPEFAGRPHSLGTLLNNNRIGAFDYGAWRT